MFNAPVKSFCPNPLQQPRGQRENVCDKKSGALESDVNEGRNTGKLRD